MDHIKAKQVENSIKQIAYNEYKRDPHDWYCETAKCVDQALDYLEMPTTWSVYDPACGRGNILDRCAIRGHHVYGTDIVDRGSPHQIWTWDFIRDPHNSECDAVFTNPPFFHSEGALTFIKHGLIVAHKMVVVLVPITFLASQARREFFQTAPGLQILFLSERPSMPPGTTLEPGQEGKGGKRDYCWLVFRKGEPPRPPWWL